MNRRIAAVAAAVFALAGTVSSLCRAEDAPLQALPYTPSLDVTAMDRSVDPCKDLYTYSCGGWRAKNPIPPDQANWSVYGKLYEDNQRYLWGILADAAKPSPSRNPTQQRIGDFFGSCMDTASIEAAGATPLKADLDRLAAMTSAKQIGPYLGAVHARHATGRMLFGSGVEQDAKQSSEQIIAIYAGGLGLPDRDYYFKDDADSKKLRQSYLDHVRKMLALLGDSPEAASAGAATVMRIETALAKASLNRVEKRDPYKIYHHTSPAKLKSMVPSFDWDGYFAALGGGPREWLNVSEPKFMKELQHVLKSEPLADVKTYLRWTLVNVSAPYLSTPFASEDFAFYRGVLRGVKEDEPRWKKCVGWVDRDLGEALGKEFVDRAFPEEMKTKTVAMTNLIVAAMGARIDALEWMSPETKKQAKDKLAKIRNKVGYPDKWRDYSSLTVTPGDFFGNVASATLFENRRELAKIGKPVDRGEWDMSPPTVNAYYNASMNDINFPAGVLMPPLFDAKLDDAPNYGNTGSTIGHELTHGFDDEGRQFDGDGNLRDWWTKKDGENFEARANCVRNQYSQYVIVDDVKINGKLTAGEDIADLGGSILAWAAWKEATKGLTLQAVDGLTPEQRFFVGLAQWACENDTPENLRLRAATNPHSPGKYRINGVVVNMPEFARAFQCKGGSALAKKPEDVCKIW
ncbi:MAG TPA: M13 family metallopeptidase [Candidatus Sulfotelmatobacter sp.]|jgi:endothelin-converting enzyme/putative endopeptidase|nr:M13 family metallopeptidase [Candidatus Sulfotelmatobacter sp.]